MLILACARQTIFRVTLMFGSIGEEWQLMFEALTSPLVNPSYLIMEQNCIRLDFNLPNSSSVMFLPIITGLESFPHSDSPRLL